MSSIKAVFGADTHISETTWASRNNLQGDAFFGFQQLVDLAVDYAVPLVLAGDCWELMRQPRPSSTTVAFMRSQIDRLAEKKLPLYYINGQHDALASPYWFEAIHTWPTHVGGKTFELNGKPWFGLDFFETYQFPMACESVPEDTFGLIVHQLWKEFAGDLDWIELRLAEVPHAKRVLSGDYHVTAASSMLMGSFERDCISPGATHMRTIGEQQEHSAVLLDSDDKFQIAPLKSRPVMEVDAHDAMDFLEQVEDIKANFHTRLKAALELNVWPEVSVPIILVSDHCGCEAAKTLEQELPSAHVIPKRVKVRDVTVDVQLENDSLDPKQLFMAAAAKRPISDDALKLLSRIVAGENAYDNAVEIANAKAD